jgi:uncharacterized protein (TIGR01777 family)
MKILMTGATGLIGREVGKLLIEKGHSLVVISRSTVRAKLELPFPSEIYSWQNESEDFPIHALQGVEAVINLAGEPIADGRWSNERKKRIRDSRIASTEKLISAIASSPEVSAGLRVFVQGSAIGYYGDRDDEVLDETSAKGEGFLADVSSDWEMSVDKLKTERYTEHVRIVKVRTGIVFSRHGGAMEKIVPLFARGLGGNLGTGQQWMSWIHIDDIANLFVFALENENASGVVNGVAPEPLKNERFTLEFARAVARSVFLPVPAAAIRFAMGEMATMVLSSQRVVPKCALAWGFEFKFPDAVSALRNVGEPFKGGVHEFFSEQWVPRTPQAVFPFFCSELNLEELTPPFLNFKVIGKSTADIEEGTLIDYRLSLHGVPLKWTSRIESWKPGVSFVDTQTSGPYRKWHHTHEFLPLGGGTLLRDRVLYQMPLGLVGDVSTAWKVVGDVKRIFDYRKKKIVEMFGGRI